LVLLAFCACGFVPIDKDEMLWATVRKRKMKMIERLERCIVV